MALEARAGLTTLSLLSRGRPVLVQAGIGALGPGLRYSGRVVRGKWGYVVEVKVRCVPASSGVGSELRVVRVARSLMGLLELTCEADLGCWCSGARGAVFGVVVLRHRRPGRPRLPRDPPCAQGSGVCTDCECVAWWRGPVRGVGFRGWRVRVCSRGLL